MECSRETCRQPGKVVSTTGDSVKKTTNVNLSSCLLSVLIQFRPEQTRPEQTIWYTGYFLALSAIKFKSKIPKIVHSAPKTADKQCCSVQVQDRQCVVSAEARFIAGALMAGKLESEVSIES